VNFVGVSIDFFFLLTPNKNLSRVNLKVPEEPYSIVMTYIIATKKILIKKTAFQGGNDLKIFKVLLYINS